MKKPLIVVLLFLSLFSKASDTTTYQSLYTPQEWKIIFKLNTLEDKFQSSKAFLTSSGFLFVTSVAILTPVTIVTGSIGLTGLLYCSVNTVIIKSKLNRIKRENHDLILRRNAPLKLG